MYDDTFFVGYLKITHTIFRFGFLFTNRYGASSDNIWTSAFFFSGNVSENTTSNRKEVEMFQ